MINLYKIEIHYLGSGIWVAQKNISDSEYVVVSSEAPDFLTIYSCTDDEESYLPEDMICSTHKDKLSIDLKGIYERLLYYLNKEAAQK